MSKVTLYCPEPPNLKLGPGGPGELIEFDRGFAVFDDERFPDWESWVKHPGTPHIEVLPADSEQVATGGFACDVCGRQFATAFARAGHLKTHAPKG